MAEVTDISSQLVRAEIAREQQRAAAARQAERDRQDAAREDEDAAVSVIREREDTRQSAELDARREDASRDAELANSIQRNIDLSADAAFDPDLPRGSIIDIVA